MEYILFVVSASSLVYYLICVLFTDASWSTHLYWPISACLFTLIGLLLLWDNKRKARHKWHLPIRLRTFIATSCILFYSLIVCFTLALAAAIWRNEEPPADYIILVENSNVTDALTKEDIDALNRALQHMNAYPKSKLVLAGVSRFTGTQVDEEEVQSGMKKYLVENGIAPNRIIIEHVSQKLRQNISYSLAYILADWYGREDLYADREKDPVVAMLAGKASVLRYKYVLKCTWWDMNVISYPEKFLSLPARIIEEAELFLRFHLENQFIYLMGGHYGKIHF